jgi:hypothetical protein
MTVCLVLGVLLGSPARAEYSFTEQDLARINAYKQLIKEVDAKSARQTADELAKTRYPQLNLELKEAMARTYADIVRQQNVAPKNRPWLYSKIALNMAYLQFGGGKTDDALNNLICRKLKEHLPEGISKRPGFHYSVD